MVGISLLLQWRGQSIKPKALSVVRQPPNTCEGRGKNTQARGSADEERDEDLIFDSLLRVDT
jgi:hypothetical protein